MPADHNPRKQFDESVKYAIQLATGYLRLMTDHEIDPNGLRYLELGPGADFAPQLVLASHGARVTLADKYLIHWDPDYHPDFYRAFLDHWSGPRQAIEAVLRNNSHESVLTLIKEPAENLLSITDGRFDFVQSNAVLEHVLDIEQAARELARVTRPGGIHTHQVDFRDHRDFQRPLDHLLLGQRSYARFRGDAQAVQGTAMRMPELLEILGQYFWIWEVEANVFAEADYMDELRRQLPPDSPYSYWPAQLLRVTSGRLWLVAKDHPKRRANSYAITPPAVNRIKSAVRRLPFMPALIARVRAARR